MVISDYEIKLQGRGNSIKIVPLGDLHLGALGCDEKRLNRDIKKIADEPDTYWVGTGDYIDAIERHDEKRFAPTEVTKKFHNHFDILPQMECELFIETIRPIAHKCIGLIRGNHEDQYVKRHSWDPIREACKALSLTDLSDMAFIRLNFTRGENGGRRMFIVLATHGSGGGVTAGAKFMKLDRIMSRFDADLYVQGHVHNCGSLRSEKLGVTRAGKGHIIDKHGGGLIGKTYLRTYQEGQSNYAQKQHMPPSSLGMVWATIKPFASFYDDAGKQVEYLDMELTI